VNIKKNVYVVCMRQCSVGFVDHAFTRWSFRCVMMVCVERQKSDEKLRHERLFAQQRAITKCELRDARRVCGDDVFW